VPGGKLPFTWPRTGGHIPLIASHTASHEPERQDRRYWDEPSTPLFPFGHGLSYTTFAYDGLRLDRDRIAAGEALTVAVEVTNSGAFAGDEVVQLYIRQRYGRTARPVRELKGFRRVALEVGETRTVEFVLGPDQLRYWHPLERDWALDAAMFDVWVGGDVTAQLHTAFQVHSSPGQPTSAVASR
jgi:beta-glucosidase